MHRENTLKDKQLQAALTQIRARFLEDLESRIEALDNLLTEIENTQYPKDALVRVAALMHKISGVGPTLGFSELGQMAARAERHVEAILRQPLSPTVLADFVGQQDAVIDHMVSLKAAS